LPGSSSSEPEQDEHDASSSLRERVARAPTAAFERRGGRAARRRRGNGAVKYSVSVEVDDEAEGQNDGAEGERAKTSVLGGREGKRVGCGER